MSRDCFKVTEPIRGQTQARTHVLTPAPVFPVLTSRQDSMIFFTSVQHQEDNFPRNACYCWGFIKLRPFYTAVTFLPFCCVPFLMGTKVEDLEHKPNSQLQRFSAQGSPCFFYIPPDSPTQIIRKQTWTSCYLTHKYFGMCL